MKPTRPATTICSFIVPAVLAALGGCVTPAPSVRPGSLLARSGDEIVVCGQLFHTGAPVVLWLDPGGYDAYRAECHFDPNQLAPSKPVSTAPTRYSTFRGHLPDDVADQVRTSGWTLPLLQDQVDLFVLHYDVCGTSRRCFQVLHDLRGLSVQFMLDVDGTIYQTLDLKERAWHAGSANDRSVGIEIANMGAWKDTKTLDDWYGRDAAGRTFLIFPASLGPNGVRNPDFVARPARDDIVIGDINGQQLHQYDLTDAQYDSLIKLIATVTRVLPRIRLDYPRDADGHLRTTVLTPEELADFHGLVGHFHITNQKVDPGPAFNWDRLLNGVKELTK